jgi:hypothetical protein
VSTRTIKASVAAILGIGIGVAFLDWYPFPFSLAWPGLLLARAGLPHSWFLAAASMIGILVWFAFRSRGRAWIQVIAVPVLGSAAYCAIAFFYLARLPVPSPKTTPYEDAPAQRAVFLASYNSGYRDGMAGVDKSYCFRPEADTRGFEEGSRQGLKVWHRLMGWKTEGLRRSIQRSAAIDGVRLNSKSAGGQSDPAASGSQLILSETNITSSAADSLR